MTEARKLVPLSTIQPGAISWLWKDRIPLGCLSILEGDPGQGKSAVTYDLAARLTTGKPMPGEEETSAPAGVVLLQGEDVADSMMRPRLAAAGADLSKILVDHSSANGGTSLQLPDDLGVVEDAIRQANAKLLVIDPLSAFIAAGLQTEGSMRRVLGPLATLAESTGAAVLLVRHLAKRTSSRAMYAGSGSIAIVAAARSCLRVFPDTRHDDDRRHVIAPVKSNLSTATPLAYRTIEKEGSIAIEWLGEVEGFNGADCNHNDSPHSAIVEAEFALYSILADGPVPANEAYSLTRKAGLCKRTVDRAKANLRIRSRRVGSGRESRWEWELPSNDSLVQSYRERELDELMRRLTDPE